MRIERREGLGRTNRDRGLQMALTAKFSKLAVFEDHLGLCCPNGFTARVKGRQGTTICHQRAHKEQVSLPVKTYNILWGSLGISNGQVTF